MTGRLRLYLRYSTRSLRRGGRRTTLAIFCIAVGVMAVVSLRLAGDMISNSLTGNVREANGGDVSVQSTALPLERGDLARLDRLQRNGVIERYQPLGLQFGTARGGNGRVVRTFTYILDDPSAYPLVGESHISSPAGISFKTALGRPDGLVLSRFAAEQTGSQVGARVHFTLVGGGGRDLTVAGIVDNRLAVGGPSVAYIDHGTFAGLISTPERYGAVQVITADTDHARQAADQLRQDFPTATVQTVAEALDRNLQTSADLNTFLRIVGLLALLIGGIGIINTLQVILSRRRIEIAMLKTTGYRRRDLYALFGLETGILGLCGGLLGTVAGIAVSALVKALLERALTIRLTFVIAPSIVLSGVVVGLATSLIFGLLPIVRAAAVRPQAVLRDLPEGRTTGSRLQLAGLYALLVLLFTLLSATLIGGLLVALITVLATAVVVGVLGLLFAGVAWVVGRLPAPERASPGFLALVTAAVAASALVATRLPAVGASLLAATSMGYVVLLLPRRERTIVRLSLRAVGRARARTSSTLVALFIGVFTVGLILVVGQDLSAKVDDSLNRLADFSVFAIASNRDAAGVVDVTAKLPGVNRRRITEDEPAVPTAINDVPFGDYLRRSSEAPEGNGERQFRLFSLTGIQGYDLGANDVPDTEATSGRALNAGDGGSANVMLRQDLRDAPLHLKTGDLITLQQPNSRQSVTVRAVGFYSPVSTGASGLRIKLFFQPILGDRGVTRALGSADIQTIVALQLNPLHRSEAVRTLQSAVPGATVFDVADLSAVVQELLGNVLNLLIAIASLSLFAGVVIIANTVALAMLERRRDIGILKATGYTSRSVLAQILIENGIVGLIGAVSGMAVVSLAANVLGSRALNTELAVSTTTALGVIVGIVALTMLVAGLVAWGPTRVRPLEVLRYE